jgi:hypothetical protein
MEVSTKVVSALVVEGVIRGEGKRSHVGAKGDILRRWRDVTLFIGNFRTQGCSRV